MINEGTPIHRLWLDYLWHYIHSHHFDGGLQGGDPSYKLSLTNPLLLVRDWVQTGLESKHQPWIGFHWAEEAAAGGRERGGQTVWHRWGSWWRWREMELQTSLGKRINPRLCHPVGLMCCVSVKQLDGCHLYPSQSILPGSERQFKGSHGADRGCTESERKHLRGRRGLIPQRSSRHSAFLQRWQIWQRNHVLLLLLHLLFFPWLMWR